MCDPMTVMLAASTTMSVAGTLQQGRAQQRGANEDAALMEYQARVEQDNALADAKAIRRAGEKARGETLSGIVAAGVKVGEGSALDAERQVLQDTETDAAMAILNGERAARGLTNQAERTRRAGRDARSASYLAAAGSLLSAGSQGLRASGFRSNGPGWSGTQAPAPVETRYVPRG